MRENLSIGSTIILNEIGTEKKFTFEIQDVIGMGASCIVYTAIYRDAEQNVFTVRLKECFPDGLNISRNGATLTIPEENAERFQKHIQHFTDGFQKQIAFRSILESQNSISNIQGIFEGNGTKYIAMSCQNGIRLDKANLSLYDAFRVLRAVTQQIQIFHEHGWLYLDLKPENVILYPETPELVMLFDFDSAVQISEIKPEYISFTKSWSAPEVVQRKVQSIGICSDVYSIGALLLYLIFDRSPELSDRRKRASWDFDNCILSEESPEVKRMVTELFTHTLCTDVRARYSSCEEILDVIEPFIESFQKQKPYLKTVLPMNNNFFCGRDREIDAIHTALQEDDDFLVLHGIGGIGKSELAKHYATAFSDSYDAVIFVHFQNSIIETVASDGLFPVVNLERSENESDADYFARKLKVLQKITTPRHLIILDNFDTDECENLDELLALKCKFLITSRVDFEDIFPQLEVDVLDEFDDLRTIFSRYSKLEPDDDIDNIIYALSGHTMAIELASKQMKVNNISSEEMYKKLCEHGISADDNKVKNLKDGILRNKAAYTHIEILFDIFALSEDEKQILRYIGLTGATPVYADFFKEMCSLEENDMDCLSQLIRTGWVQDAVLNDSVIITPHSLIVEVLIKQLQPDTDHCLPLIESCTSIASSLDALSVADDRMLYVQILDHVAHTIIGCCGELAFFYSRLTTAVYLRENMFQKALWATYREIEILEKTGLGVHLLVDALIHGRDAAKFLRNELEFQHFDMLLHTYEESDEFRLEVLNEEMLDAVTEYDFDTAQAKAEEKIEVAIRTQDDYKISSAYSDMLLVQNTFQVDENKAFYAEKELQYILKYYTEHGAEYDKVSDDYALLCYDIADAYKDNEMYQEAISYYQKFAEVKHCVLDGDYSFWITAYSEIGNCYGCLLDFERLLEFYDKAVETAEKFYGEEHIETGKVLMFYSNAINEFYNKTQNTDVLAHSKTVMERAISIYQKGDEVERIGLNNLYVKYATVLTELKLYDECRKYAEMALEYFSSDYDRSDYMIARIYLIIGDSYLFEKDRENAEKYYQLALQLYEENEWDSDSLKEVIQDAFDKAGL